MAEISLKGVTKSFGKNEVIHRTDVTIADGEFVVIVGPSGCGKSTVLRMIAGLETATEGEIRIGGKRVNEVEPKDRNIAMVFQNYALYPHMSVYDNMAYGLKIRKLTKEDIEKRVQRAAGILELGPYLQRKPRELSGGQRQRVAMGRAIVREPAAFLFDEPLSNLDAKLRVQMRAEIKKIQRRLQTTTIYVTHDQVEAMTMGSRIAVLEKGKLQQVGAPLEVYERPANAFVAQFIGTPPMNFVRGALADGGARVTAGSFSIPVPAALRGATAGRDGGAVLAGIRPEHVMPPGHAGRGETAPVQVAVEIVETLGDEIVVHARAGEDAVVYKEDPHRAPEPGDAVTVQLELSALHLFDAATEARLG
jgi:multiple sugar transport system ATP-binding protein